VSFGGPMFEPSEDEWRRSVSRKEGGHYNIYGLKSSASAMEFLKQYFPDGEANALNFVLFSTSGVHGTYTTLDEIEHSMKTYPNGYGDEEDTPDDYHYPEVTVLIVQPRIVGMTYGNVKINSMDDLRYLKKLRKSSWKAVLAVGVE
jgi:hypothetical protein